ncbi:hypothetical protein V3C99_008130 [Haemonchus contortus]|uniref:Homeobox domain-containing protein n=1 Tax=Haemonchus contortus TaxID=6289 RepID=A0A7I4Z503_HAECO
MGAEQSLESLSKSDGNTNRVVANNQTSKTGSAEEVTTSNSGGGRSSQEFSTYRGFTSGAIPSTVLQRAPTPATVSAGTSNNDRDHAELGPYPFRTKVKHLSLEERKLKYEEEIRRLFQSPHPSHATRLAAEKTRKEKADIPPTKNSVVTWNESQLTFDIGKGALSQRAFKRCNRSRPDPWRRYGALRKLHEIGGTGCTPPNQTGVRVQQKFYHIEAGSQPPPPPDSPPITSIDEYGTIDILLNPKKRKNKEKADERSD